MIINSTIITNKNASKISYFILYVIYYIFICFANVFDSFLFDSKCNTPPIA